MRNQAEVFLICQDFGDGLMILGDNVYDSENEATKHIGAEIKALLDDDMGDAEEELREQIFVVTLVDYLDSKS